jgi:ribosomal protein S18 acetylase RimI-like enzyme
MSKIVMEKGRVKLRTAEAKDIKSMIVLLGELERPLPKDKYENSKFQKLINGYIQSDSNNGNLGIILATINSRIVGLVSFVLLERLNQSSRELWIPDLVVSGKHRKRGIGKLLAKRCESIAKRKKCYRIRLESRKDRTDSHKFYTKMGFQQIALVFEKRLKV